MNKKSLDHLLRDLGFAWTVVGTVCIGLGFAVWYILGFDSLFAVGIIIDLVGFSLWTTAERMQEEEKK